MKAALVQMTSGDDPAENLPTVQALIAEAVGQGARFILTPEVTNCVSTSRAHQHSVLRHEQEDETLGALQAQASALGVWVLVGSMAFKTEDSDGRFANRSILIAPDGQIAARYDKIHMFDVEVSEAETYRESAGYRPGKTAVMADVDGISVGLTICYDLRFPHLFRRLAQAGAQVIAVPSAFSPVTGAAHWQPLLRARAIETGCYILAPAQTGQHPISQGKPRSTYGHSLVVSPWGEVLGDAGTDPGLIFVDLDVNTVDSARRRVPSLGNDAEIDGPV